MNLLTVIIVAIAAFLAVTLILVALLLFAKAKLTTSGDVTININDGQKMLTVAGGSSLLNTLTSQGIFLPSACGGKGACGQCKCQVLEGGGDILPTETGFFNRKQIQDHWRLGCQVKVKENMKIAVPASVLSIKKWECEVVSNHNVATFIGYKMDKFSVAAEYNLMMNSGYVTGRNQYGVSAYSTVKLNKITNLYARYDNLMSNNAWNIDKDEQSIVAGLEVKLHKFVKLAPNFRMSIPKAAGARNVYMGYISCSFGI